MHLQGQADYNGRVIPVTARDEGGRNKGERRPRKAKEEVNRPLRKVQQVQHHHSCCVQTRVFNKQVLSAYPGTVKPWETDSNQPNPQETERTNPNLHLLATGWDRVLSAPWGLPPGAEGMKCLLATLHPSL